MLGNRADAEDAVQNALAAYRTWISSRGNQRCPPGQPPLCIIAPSYNSGSGDVMSTCLSTSPRENLRPFRDRSNYQITTLIPRISVNILS
jgi:hypothetical protein